MKETNKNINNSNYNSTEDNYYFLNVLKQLFEDALKFSSKYINDGNSIYYHIDYELEQALQNDKKLLFEKIEILKNIYTSPEEVEFIDRFALFYDTFNKIYIGVKHSEGFSHYLTVRFLKDSLKEYLIYQTDNYSIEFLTSFDDIDFEISKNKSKLAFSLIELKLNGKVDRNFMDKYFSWLIPFCSRSITRLSSGSLMLVKSYFTFLCTRYFHKLRNIYFSLIHASFLNRE